MRLVAGVIAGAAIASVDNFAFGGEVSPIVIVVMLILATSIAAAVWGRQAWITSAVIWVCVPLVHLVKHLSGLPDTLHPNAYSSIAILAGFTLLVTGFGTAVGILIHRVA